MPSLEKPMSLEEKKAAQNLKEAILTSELSQVAIAKQLQRSESTISQWVNANCTVPPKWAQPLSEMLKVRPEEICTKYLAYQSQKLTG